MKKLVIGILAHVDAGKTTLSECMMYLSGMIRKMGRVDNKDAFLDTFSLERERGITIFSKQAVFTMEDTSVTLLDTPGHVDFSAEMERTLQVLDYAILVVSGADGVQGHTQTLWKLLLKYNIPVFVFINKMDQNGTDKNIILSDIKKQLDSRCVDFTDTSSENFYEDVAVCDEMILEQYLEDGEISEATLIDAISKRIVFPCFFGSALKVEGVQEFMSGIHKFTKMPSYPEEFGAKTFKIARDEAGNRLTYLKVTGGTLKVKSIIDNSEDKINQIRIYSGLKYDTASEVEAGCVCAVTGLSKTKPGQGYGIEAMSMMPILEPVLTYQIILPAGVDASAMLPKLRLLEEEEPQLHIVWNETLKEIQVQIMGEVQIEILKRLIHDRFGVDVTFGVGNIVYKETIKNTVEGVGHFEPLRHYAEVHLKLEPGKSGSGLIFETDCSEEILEKNWQRLILTHLKEKEHHGVITGAGITDMKITLIAGRAHQKHTEGGDFREATYRAVRQGLMQADSILLEPYYDYQLEVPETVVGRAMTDIEKMNGTFEITSNDNGMTILRGVVPVSTMRDYQTKVVAYTKGHGRLFCTLRGYEPCHNASEVMEQVSYEPEADIENPASSVFCSHGAGFLVPWNQVKEYMHVDSGFIDEDSFSKEDEDSKEQETNIGVVEEWIDTEEIDSILEKTFYANRGNKVRTYQKGRKDQYVSNTSVTRVYKKSESLEKYLLVDGYNIIYAWEELNKYIADNMDGARNKLLDILCNYQAIRKYNIIVVFDAYRVTGHMTEIMDYHNIHVVYTKEAETADQYIEKFSHENEKRYDITVATSDGVEQVIIRGQGCKLLSARELQEDVMRVNHSIRKDYLVEQKTGKNFLFDSVSKEVADHIEQIVNGKEDKN